MCFDTHYAMVQKKERYIMTFELRALLILCSIFFFLIITHKIRNLSVKIIDMFYWILLSVLFVLMGLFQDIVGLVAHWIGFESPTNFVFLVVIFLLLWKTFSLSLQFSQQSEKLKDAIEELAIRQTREQNETREVNETGEENETRENTVS